MTPQTSLKPSECHELLRLARQTLEQAVHNQPPAQIQTASLPRPLTLPGACFVTLTQHQRLRGCIGQLFPSMPLYQAVLDNTRAAARSDPRFPPVQPRDLPEIRIEISVLTDLQPLQAAPPDEWLRQLRPNVDGVVLYLGDKLTTFLPQVWNQFPNPAQFLERLAQKAGAPPGAWRTHNARLSIYQAQVFAEPD
jgi:AmmeMemoRadiSam system protein A